VLTTGLELPYKLTFTAAGNLLVSQAGLKPNTGRVYVVDRSGAKQSLLEGLPSGPSNPNMVPIGPTGLALRGDTLFIAIAEGDALRNGTTPGSLVLNPDGVSSPIFSCVLRVRFSGSVDSAKSPFALTMAQQWELADGAEVTVENAEGMKAVFDVLVDFPPVTSDPVTKYRHSDPFNLALDPAHPDILYVIDSGQNTLIRVNVPDRHWEVITRFAPIKNPSNMGPPFMDAVPTAAVVMGEQIMVSLLSGFPFVPGYASIRVVDPVSRSNQVWIDWLTTATDFATRLTSSGSTQAFVIGFSANLESTPPAPGKLWQYDSPQGKVILDDLVTPTGIALDPVTGEIFITELSTGLIKRVQAQ
jgi:hypothetical protein